MRRTSSIATAAVPLATSSTVSPGPRVDARDEEAPPARILAEREQRAVAVVRRARAARTACARSSLPPRESMPADPRLCSRRVAGRGAPPSCRRGRRVRLSGRARRRRARGRAGPTACGCTSAPTKAKGRAARGSRSTGTTRRSDQPLARARGRLARRALRGAREGSAAGEATLERVPRPATRDAGYLDRIGTRGAARGRARQDGSTPSLLEGRIGVEQQESVSSRRDLPALRCLGRRRVDEVVVRLRDASAEGRLTLEELVRAGWRPRTPHALTSSSTS